jgi:uncharacterized membrane protein YphA (DoxX/SURF4 family)
VSLLLPSLLVTLPFPSEQFYLRKKFGPFAILSGLSLLQIAILFGGETLPESSAGIQFPAFVVVIGKAPAVAAFLPICATSIAAVVLVLFLLWVAIDKASNKFRGT